MLQEFIIKRVKICTLAYQLLQSICYKNDANEKYILPKLPFFQIQAKVIPGAIECIISIIRYNHELKINFDDYKKPKNPLKNVSIKTEGQRKSKKLVGKITVEQMYNGIEKYTKGLQDRLYHKWDALGYFITLMQETKNKKI